jgi:heme/copper-type cytochrome/quinol oxidase subunit 3
MTSGDYVAGGRRLSDVPHTTGADGAQAVRLAVDRRYGRPAALWGMLILIASEATLFGCFIGTYYYLRFTHDTWPLAGDPEPKVVVPLILAACLALTVVPMHLAWRSARAARLGAARLFLVVALIVQCGYLAYEVHDSRDQLDRLPITRDAYSSVYYTLLGAAHAHVLVGILFVVWLLWKLAFGLTTYRVNAAQAIALYWYFVGALTLVVVGVLVSAAI